MTKKTIEHFFSITSPWTFLGFQRLSEIAARNGATIVHKPVDLGKVFSVSGGLPLPKRAPQRQAYRLVELARWRTYLGIPLNVQPKFFPVKGWPAAGMVIAARERNQDYGTLAHAILRAVWVEERNIDDAATLEAIAAAQGFDGRALIAAAESDAVKKTFETDTQEAMERGVFGAPTYVYKGEMFWGQDRLDFLERAVKQG